MAFCRSPRIQLFAWCCASLSVNAFNLMAPTRHAMNKVVAQRASLVRCAGSSDDDFRQTSLEEGRTAPARVPWRRRLLQSNLDSGRDSLPMMDDPEAMPTSAPTLLGLAALAFTVYGLVSPDQPPGTDGSMAALSQGIEVAHSTQILEFLIVAWNLFRRRYRYFFFRLLTK